MTDQHADERSRQRDQLRVTSLRDQLLKLPLVSLSRDGVKETQARMLSLLEQGGAAALDRAYPHAHFTASAFVCSPSGDLLALHHRKLDRWLQPGGHIEPQDDNPLSAALREAREESGLNDLTPLASHPIDLDIHLIPARPNESEHAHYDVRYALLAPRPQDAVVSEESHALRWLSGDELSAWRMSEPSIERAVNATLRLLKQL